MKFPTTAGAVASALLIAALAPAQTLQWTTREDSLRLLMPNGIQMNATAVVTIEGNTFAYILGGNRSTDAGGDSTGIYYAAIVGDQIGPWSEASARLERGGTAYHTRSAVTFGGRIYLAGGRFNSEGDYSTTYNGVRVFAPEASGDIPADAVTYYSGPTSDPTLDLLEMAAVVAPSRLHQGDGIVYILGGGSGTSITQAVRSFRISGESGAIVDAGPNGELEPALRTLEPLPTPTAFAQAVLHDGRIYVIGNAPPATRVHYATIREDDTLEPWRATTAELPERRLDAGAASFAGNLYVLGGTAGTNENTRSTVFRASFGLDGDVTSWAIDAPIPVTPGVRRIGATVTPEALLLIGGRLTADDFSPHVQVAVPAKAAE